MEPDNQKPAYIHDVFISYSRKDKEFTKKLEKALEDYKPPKNLNVPQRNLYVFRDEEDFTGVEYHDSLAKHLKDSARLMVVCSPNARESNFVNEEIKLFAEANGANNIIPIIISGIPNNEAKPGQEEEMAFPKALCSAMEMPLAADYRNFDLNKDKVNKDVFEGSWASLLSNIYGISRSEFDQREKKRKVRRRNITIGIVSGVIALLLAALVTTLISRQEAVKQRNMALARQLEAESRELVLHGEANLPKDPQFSLLLGVDDTVRIWDAIAGKNLEELGKAFALSVCWSRDGRFLAGGSGDSFAKVWDSETYEEVMRLESPETLIGTRTSFGASEYVTGMEWSSDGKYLAIADRGGFSGKPVVLIYNMSLLAVQDTEDLLAVARNQVTRDLTTAECKRYLHVTTCPRVP